jgi:hypothetical protein
VSATLPAPSTTSWPIVEDWSEYTTIDEYLNDRDPHSGRYRNLGTHPDRMSFDSEAAFGGSPHALRYSFPDRTNSADRCGNYSIGRDLYLPEGVKELWVEAWVRFASNFATTAPTAWGCTNNPDLKLLLGLVNPEGVGRFQVKAGKFGWAWATGGPDPNAHDVTLQIPSGSYMDGEWHQVRTHWKLGTGNGAVELWLDGEKVYENLSLSSEATAIWALRIGANTNQGPGAEMSYWWGRLTAWRNRPDWD